MLHKIMIVGEAWSRDDEANHLPFTGASGWMLKQILSQNGIDIRDCYLTNVFNFRPPSGTIKNLAGDKKQAIPGLPKHSEGWIRNEFAPELDRLRQEIRSVRPNLILALGGTASWFLVGDGRISKIRGSTLRTQYGKVLSSYHPTAVLREYSLRPILTMDLSKAAREQEFPDVRRLRRYIHIDPSWSDIQDFYRSYIVPSPVISTDVETIGNQITCIGLAPSHNRALVIPFYDPTRPGGNYWPDLASEVQVWKFLRRLFAEPRANVGQNFLYDARFLWRSYGIPVHGMVEGDDTMLMHHALQPELQKGLAFLGSIYCNEEPWKLERKSKTLKKEDD